MRVYGKRLPLLFMAAVLVTASVSSAFNVDTASAGQITVRKLTLLAGTGDSNSDGFPDGGSMPGAVVNHQYDFTIPTNGMVGAIKFEYCTTASGGSCTMPTGLVTTSATLGNDTSPVSGFTLNNTANGAPLLTRTAAATPGANTVVSYRLDGITNPNVPGTPNYTFFVRITTYSDTAATTTVDTGTVAASTSTQIQLSGTMPESLIFCTGGDITTTNGIPDCTTATSGSITFNQLFSPTDTSTAVSKMAASTNALNGYAITVTGPTLTSGSYTIPALNSADTSKKGFGQFGMNLRANTTATSTVAIGADVAPTSDAAQSLRALPTAGYNTVDSFKFTSGETIAKSDFGGSDGPTNSQIYTASYIVNVTGAQVAGTYTTTLTYVCTPTF